MNRDYGTSSDTHLTWGAGIDPSTEALIEKFVRFPEELDENTYSLIASEIDRDPAFRALMEFYESVYLELDRLPTRTPSQLEDFISSIFPIPQVIPLLPIERERTSEAKMSVLLPGVDPRGQLVIRTPLVLLGSKEVNIVVVFLNDIESKERWHVQLYAIDPANRCSVLLTVPEIALDLFIANASADFTTPDLEDDLQKLASAILRLPTMHASRIDGSFSGDLPQIDKETLQMPSGHILRFVEHSNLLVVDLDGSSTSEPTSIRRIAITAEGRRTHILRVASGYGHVSIENPASAYKIWFYE